jgi:hypothetical protein
MNQRLLALSGGLVVSLVLGSGSAAAQSSPRTPWGDPDLQGAWTNATITPLERPRDVGDREFFTEEEIRKRDQDAATAGDQRSDDVQRDVSGAYNAFWWDRGTSVDLRTSLIIDPKGGKIPALTADAKQRVAAEPRFDRSGIHDSWTQMTPYDRCIVRSALPRLSTGYNNNYQIVQTPGYVAILQEQMHEVRIIPLDGRPHIPGSVRQWLGDSRGRWEGETLVVETTNFSDQATFREATPDMHLVERFTRVGKDEIKYEFTVSDPKT